MHDAIRERVRIGSTRGFLAAELAYPVHGARGCCLLVNPHPHMGGRMDNNVIARVAAALPAIGVVTLRFDYAGVGESEGEPLDVAASMGQFWETGRAPEDPLMVEDARAALAWLREQGPWAPVVFGYSFGAAVAVQIVPPDAPALILVSPTITRHDFASLDAGARPTLVVYGENDFAAGADEVRGWLDGVPGAPIGCYLPGGEHFFRGCEDGVARHCVDLLRPILPQASEAPCP